MSIVYLTFGAIVLFATGFMAGAKYRTHTERYLPRAIRTTEPQRSARVVSPTERKHNSLKAFESKVL